MYLLDLIWALVSVFIRRTSRSHNPAERDTKAASSTQPGEQPKTTRRNGWLSSNAEAKTSRPLTRSQALNSIRGQKALVPDLLQQFPEWTLGMNPNVERLKEELHEWIVMYGTARLSNHTLNLQN